MTKYLFEKISENNVEEIERFYFNTLEDLQQYIDKNIKTMFNNGFSSKIIRISRIYNRGGRAI